jgi:spore germination cell wall hydrolase CwlJ-like protein
VSSRSQIAAATVIAAPLLLMPPVAGPVSAAGVTHSQVRKAKAKRTRIHHHRKHKRKKPPKHYRATKDACVMLSDEDRDLIVRTVMGEANNEPLAGKVAVAAVIRNRLMSGDYGDTVPGVLFAKKQFEPWATRKRELLSYSQDDPAYQEAADAVDLALNGEDPTHGATHFANVSTVRDRGNTSALGWIAGMSNKRRIGNHTFGNADGKGSGGSAGVYDDDGGDSVLGRMRGHGRDPDEDDALSLGDDNDFDLDSAMAQLEDPTDDPRRLAVRSMISELLDGLQPSAGQGHAVAQPDAGAAEEDEET